MSTGGADCVCLRLSWSVRLSVCAALVMTVVSVQGDPGQKGERGEPGLYPPAFPPSSLQVSRSLVTGHWSLTGGQNDVTISWQR